MPPKQAGQLNLPNIITIVRIALVPFFIWMLVASDPANAILRWATVAVFIGLIITDTIDGQIARKRNLITNLGKLLDPIADKVLIGGAFIALSALGRIDWTITVLILIREFGITAYRLIVAKRRVVAAATSGKVKTVLQAVAIGFCLSPLAGIWVGFEITQTLIVYAALIATLLSGIMFLNAERKASA
ncbi:MAG: CDP-diacylglycerol--glycerol-3-phosphate 3-phosphatidyltransferase [Micrococcales bacterium]